MSGLGLILPGVDPTPDFETYDSRIGVSAAALAANTLYLSRLDDLEQPQTISTMTHFVGTASGNCMDALYTFDGSNFAKVAASASTAIAGTNTTQDVSLSAAYTRQPRTRYYSGFIVDNATATISRLASGAPVNGKGRKSVTHAPGSFTLPDTIAVGAVSATAITVWQHGE